MSGIRAISSAYIRKNILTALAKEMPLQFEIFSSFSNSLINIMKSLGLLRQPCLKPNLQRKVCNTLAYSHSGLNSFIDTSDNFKELTV